MLAKAGLLWLRPARGIEFLFLRGKLSVPCRNVHILWWGSFFSCVRNNNAVPQKQAGRELPPCCFPANLPSPVTKICKNANEDELESLMLEIQFGQASDPGRARSGNEDAMGVVAPASAQEAAARGWLFVVADGVGGQDFGDVASACVVAAMTEGFRRAAAAAPLQSLLPNLIQQASRAVVEEGLRLAGLGASGSGASGLGTAGSGMAGPGMAGQGRKMGSTVVACALRQDQMLVAHVGDSRCYQVRNGKVTLVTSDHTLVNEQRRMGLISAAEAEGSAVRNVLTRSLGLAGQVEVEVTPLALAQSDVLVLCTDGVYDRTGAAEIARIVSQKKAAQALAQELVEHAVRVDGSDNATAQVIVVHSARPTAMYRGRPYRMPTT